MGLRENVTLPGNKSSLSETRSYKAHFVKFE